MMGLGDIRDLVSSLFIMLNQNTYILFRIEFLVLLVTVLFLAMFIMDIFRRRIHSSAIKAIFSLFDAVSDSIVIYLLGAMQTAHFKNQLFPVWALVLVILRYSVDFVSGYGVPDNGGRRFTEWRNVVKLLGAAFLNKTRGSRFAAPLWSLWGLQIVRSGYRFRSHTLASNSPCHGLSSEIVSEHMRKDFDDPRKWKDCDPETLKGYEYLVYGETAELQKPRYALCVEPTDTDTTLTNKRIGQADRQDTNRSKTNTRSSLITLDKIWGCHRHLLRSKSDHSKSKENNDGKDLKDPSLGNIQGNELKDISLAFALSRLLRCRLEDVILPVDIYHINQNLVMKTIIEEGDVMRAFRVMELQLAFVNEYFNTRYPMIFWSGLDSLFFSILLSVATIGVICWLSVDIRKVYKPPEGELAHVVQGCNIDMIITWVFMFFMIFKEVWEIVTYILSNWTRLFLVCMYAGKEDEHTRNICMERLISSIFKSKIVAKSWHGLIDQYVFVQSYDDKPKVWNWIHNITTGMVPKKNDGAKLDNAIKLPECVMSEILKKLHAILDLCGTQGNTEPVVSVRNYEKPTITDGPCLPKVITLFQVDSDKMERYGWACFDLQTSSDIILVWHIATSFCEMAIAKQFGVDLSKPASSFSLLSFFKGCCSSKPYLVDVYEMNENYKGEKTSKGTDSSNPSFLCSLLSCFKNCCPSKSNEKKVSELQKRYIIANSLSRYCAYLLVSKPELIPDSFLVPNMIFQRTVRSACDEILRYSDSLEKRYTKLSLEASKAAEDSDNVKKGEDVVKQGAMLGKLLLDHEGVEECWEILAGVWAELLIHIAPTWNAEAHKKYLGSGGEFITNIWALLWHCGIEKSNLWPTDIVYEDNDPTDPKDNDVGNNHTDTAEEMQQAGTDTRNQEIRTEDHVEDEIVETEKPNQGEARV